MGRCGSRECGRHLELLRDSVPRRWPTFLAGTPAADLSPKRSLPFPAQRSLRRLEHLNLVVLMLVRQLVQSLFVTQMVALFLVVLGMIVVPASVQDAWAGAPVRDLVGFVFLGEPRTLSLELLISVALPSGICGLYFTGLALTDATYRAEFNARDVADIERIMAVRVRLSSHARYRGPYAGLDASSPIGTDPSHALQERGRPDLIGHARPPARLIDPYHCPT